MLSEKEVGLVYDTLLSAPGMSEVVKLDLRMSRKNVLLLTKVIEKGLSVKPVNSEEGLLLAVGGDDLDSLRQISTDLLAKAGLSEMSEKLRSLRPENK